jgi:hypothetical protein
MRLGGQGRLTWLIKKQMEMLRVLLPQIIEFDTIVDSGKP